MVIPILDFAFAPATALALDFIIGIAGFAKDAVYGDSKPRGNRGTMKSGTGGGSGRAALELAGSGNRALGGGARKAAKLRFIRVFGKLYEAGHNLAPYWVRVIQNHGVGVSGYNRLRLLGLWINHLQ